MENELKFLLPLTFNTASLAGWTKTRIMQGYLTETDARMWRDADGKPYFSVAIKSNGVTTQFKSSQITEEQFIKLFPDLEQIDETYYRLYKPVRIRDESGKLTLTYKHLIDGDLMELEDEISPAQFTKFQPHASNFVYKDRFSIRLNDEDWFVDVLKDFTTHAIYFVQSEVEMPVGRSTPLHMPPMIKSEIIHSVAKDDVRFTNKCLSDQHHARSLYEMYQPQ